MNDSALSAAPPGTEEAAAPPPVGVIREYYETILVCVLFILYTWTFVVMQSKIPTASMQDTLLVGDRVVVNKFVYGVESAGWMRKILPYRGIGRGDVAVFKSPEDPEKDFIKRVIAVGGDRVEIVNKQVYVNGAPLQEPYTRFNDPRIYGGAGDGLNPFGMARDNFGPVVIPEGEYFMMGDNRDNSNDSRVFGPVKREFIKGRAVLIFWSMQQPGMWDDPVQKKALNIFQSALHFFSWTRWDRIFRPVR